MKRYIRARSLGQCAIVLEMCDCEIDKRKWRNLRRRAWPRLATFGRRGLRWMR
jgi:hypothetical protein